MKAFAEAALDPKAVGPPPAADTPTTRRFGSRRRIVTIAVAAVVVVSAVVAVRSRSGGPPAAAATAATTTAPVEVKDLVLYDEYEGELGFGDASPVAANRDGVVTSVAAAGSTVEVGQVLFSIDLQPTVVLAGTVPAFRAIDQDADPAADVRQLEQALVDLGFGSGVTVDERFTASTAAAVKRWETALGRFDPDGTVELGDVVFAAGAVRVAEVTAAVGTQVRTDSTVLDASPTAKVVTLPAGPDTAAQVEAGMPVALGLPGGVDTTGKVANVAPAAATGTGGAEGGGDQSPFIVTIALDDPAVAEAFDSGTVEIKVERSRVEAATTVPVTALLALIEGGYAVQVVDRTRPEGYRLVAVEVGTYSAADVQVTGDGIERGVKVVVPK